MRYLHQDHLGSTSVITDDTGAAVYEATYDPWGKVRTSWGSTTIDRLYTGQRFDSATGLYYYNARYGACPERSRRDPTLARFISPDTIVPGFADPQEWNRYAYVLGSPLRYVDRSGNCIEPDPKYHNSWIVTHGGAARCSSDEIEALDWNFQQIWAGLVYDEAVQRKAGNGWRKLMGQLSENSYFGLLGLLGRDSRGMKDDFSRAASCWANDARSWSCQGRPITHEPKPVPRDGRTVAPGLYEIADEVEYLVDVGSIIVVITWCNAQPLIEWVWRPTKSLGKAFQRAAPKTCRSPAYDPLSPILASARSRHICGGWLRFW
jgi:RHS repeat-associated protein